MIEELRKVYWTATNGGGALDGGLLAVAEWSRQRALREAAGLCALREDDMSLPAPVRVSATIDRLAILALAAQPGTTAQGKGET